MPSDPAEPRDDGLCDRVRALERIVTHLLESEKAAEWLVNSFSGSTATINFADSKEHRGIIASYVPRTLNAQQRRR